MVWKYNANPSAAHAALMIQNLVTTFVSAQPFFSK